MKSISISIPQPCTENYGTMTPTQRGAYCLGCRKEVIDFTAWSDHGLVDFFTKKGSVCGRLRHDQLKTFEVRKDKNRMRWWVAITFVAGMFMSNTVAAQSERRTAVEQVADDNQHQTQLDQLKKWSSTRSEAGGLKAKVDPVNELQGRIGYVVAAGVPIARPWYSSIYDMLRW